MADVSRELSRIRGVGTFALTRQLPAGALDISVQDVGALVLPLTSASAEALRKVARPARYGLREKTVLDLSVRDAWEVPKSRIKIDQRAWKAKLAPELEQIRIALGLPEDPRIAEMAAVVREVARVRPYKKRRIKVLARERRDLLDALIRVGLHDQYQASCCDLDIG